MKADDQVTLLRAALISMLPQLRLADMHLGLMNHVSLENKARVALDRSATCGACLDTGASHCADPSNCGGPWDYHPSAPTGTDVTPGTRHPEASPQ